eukprot:scaffold544_cov320-Pavlova_lutheri.AAC.68
MHVSQCVARAFWRTALLLAIVWEGAGAFREGDVVPTARRLRWKDKEAPWEDLLARHCARFKHNARVAVPLPKAEDLEKRQEEQIGAFQKLLRGRVDTEAAMDDKGDEDGGAWSVALAFESGSVATSWTRVNVERQEVLVKIQHRDGNLIGVEMRAVQASGGVHDRDHLLVRYHWIEEKGVDGTRGVLWMSASALLMVAAMLIHIGRNTILDVKPRRRGSDAKLE